jgi:hypothetical protein
MTFQTIARSAAMTALMIAGAAQAAPKKADMGNAWMTYHAKTDRYCMTSKQVETGTRLPRMICRTADAWKADGISVGRR